MSPAKTNVGCCNPAPDVNEDDEDEVDAPEEAGLNNIQGTATCLPETGELDEEISVELEVDEELDELLGEVVLLVLEPAFPDNEITANSRRPEAGFTIVSLMVPI
jgi:hypothetical protein